MKAHYSFEPIISLQAADWVVGVRVPGGRTRNCRKWPTLIQGSSESSRSGIRGVTHTKGRYLRCRLLRWLQYFQVASIPLEATWKLRNSNINCIPSALPLSSQNSKGEKSHYRSNVIILPPLPTIKNHLYRWFFCLAWIWEKQHQARVCCQYWFSTTTSSVYTQHHTAKATWKCKKSRLL